MSKTRSESAANQTAQHTPKPWLIEETRNAKKWPLFEITAGNHSIADLLVSGPGESHDADGGQARQNAHLIAAAPDMLVALEECVAEWDAKWEDLPEGHGTPQDPPSILFARDAIAKAEGK
ncbi:hypothetical protein LCGC14_1377110 [marine sediment metagenome]|uniref:Uncharacterized protein n=1 Tax=marine sediment metagenome TaxID=412755 RepID=A0A0F9MJ09_9ZZZZ